MWMMTTRLALRERLKVIRKWTIKFVSNSQVLYWLTCTHFTAFSWNMHWIFARVTRWTWYTSTFYFIGLKQERTKQSKQGFKFACFCDFCLFVCKIVSLYVQCYVRGKLVTPGSYLWTPIFPKSFPPHSIWNRPYVWLRHMLKIHHQASFVPHLLKLSLPSCCFHVAIHFILTALGIKSTFYIIKARLGGDFS